MLNIVLNVEVNNKGHVFVDVNSVLITNFEHKIFRYINLDFLIRTLRKGNSNITCYLSWKKLMNSLLLILVIKSGIWR